MSIFTWFIEVNHHTLAHTVLPRDVAANGTRLTISEILASLDQGATCLGPATHTHEVAVDGTIVNIASGCLPNLLIKFFSL